MYGDGFFRFIFRGFISYIVCCHFLCHNNPLLAVLMIFCFRLCDPLCLFTHEFRLKNIVLHLILLEMSIFSLFTDFVYSTACMKLEEYQTAKAALEAGVSLAPGDSRFTNLIKECEQRIAGLYTRKLWNQSIFLFCKI